MGDKQGIAPDVRGTRWTPTSIAGGVFARVPTRRLGILIEHKLSFHPEAGRLQQPNRSAFKAFNRTPVPNNFEESRLTT